MLTFAFALGLSGEVTKAEGETPVLQTTEATRRISDSSKLDVRHTDYDYSLVSVLYQGEALKEGRDFNFDSSSQEGFESCYLASLGLGEHVFTFHFEIPETDQKYDAQFALTQTAGDEGEVLPEDPTLEITYSLRATPALTVTGYEDEDIKADCTVVWKEGSTTREEPISVLPGTELTYTVTPGDALKIDDVQYYTAVTGKVTLNSLKQAVPSALGRQGSVTVTPELNGEALPDEVYTVTWFDETGKSIGTGNLSPQKDEGTKLFYSITMAEAYMEEYQPVEKKEVIIGFGNNNIIQNITRYEKSSAVLTVKGKNGVKLIDLAALSGTDLYYEIAPQDRAGVLNWVQFKGVPLSDATKLTVTNGLQTIPVNLGTVSQKTLNGKVTNAASAGRENISFAFSQTPWSGYTSANGGYYSYSEVWKAMTEAAVLGDDSSFSVKAYDFPLSVTATDKTGNFKTIYKTVAVEDLDKAAVQAARKAYDALHDAQKAFVTETTLTKLETAEASVKAAEDKAAKEKKKATEDKKAANKITKVTAAKTVKAAALKKKAQQFQIAATVKVKAAKTFKLVFVPKSAKKYIQVSKTGKVILKKGLRKGTYQIKVKITAQTTKNYRTANIIKTIKIVVR